MESVSFTGPREKTNDALKQQGSQSFSGSPSTHLVTTKENSPEKPESDTVQASQPPTYTGLLSRH